MPKRGIAALAVTTVALVLLLSFKTPDEPLPSRGGVVAIVDPGSSTTPRPQASAAPSATQAPVGEVPTPTAPAGGTTAQAATIDGSVVSTRYGRIQVEIVVAGGRVTDVVALQLPTGRRSGQISQFSEPILRQEALTAQKAAIDIVSGATYTSDAYSRSLQSALDQAGLG